MPKQPMPLKPTKKPKRSRSAPPSASLRPVCEQRLKELAEFKRKHGHCNVPQRYPPKPPLGNWVANLRHRKKSGAVDLELVRRLDRLGFSWVLLRRSIGRHDWDAMVTALAAFKQQHGHFRVPSGRPEYRQLATWLQHVRHAKKKGLLNRRRVTQLDKLGLGWEPRAENWQEMFSALLRYRAKHGHCNVPGTWPENPKLGRWVQSQRKLRRLNMLKQAYIERLDEIGFAWPQSRCTAWDGAWESKYEALVEYRRAHGHSSVSTLDREYASLGNWVRTQRGLKRQGKLSKERVRRLDRLGFCWSMLPTQGSRRGPERLAGEKWDAMYRALIGFREVTGHCRVTAKTFTPLGRWAARQRAAKQKGRLSEERIRRLDEVGFVWDVWNDSWEAMCAALTKYREAHGHCEVRRAQNRPLASWAATQRVLEREDRLRPERKRRLTALGFRWLKGQAGDSGVES